MNPCSPSGHPAREDADDPRCEDREPDGDSPEREPDQVGDHEQDPEEDRQAAPLQVVRDDEANGVRAPACR